MLSISLCDRQIPAKCREIVPRLQPHARKQVCAFFFFLELCTFFLTNTVKYPIFPRGHASGYDIDWPLQRTVQRESDPPASQTEKKPDTCDWVLERCTTMEKRHWTPHAFVIRRIKSHSKVSECNFFFLPTVTHHTRRRPSLQHARMLRSGHNRIFQRGTAT